MTKIARIPLQWPEQILMQVKRQNERSGMSYNEVKELLARTTGGHGTGIYSDTNVEEVKRQNQESMENH